MGKCSVWWSWGLLVLGGCSGAAAGSLHERPSELAPAPSRAPVAPLSAPSIRTTTGSARVEPDSNPLVMEPPRREAAAGSTVGTIACGSARCRAGAEVCTMKSLEWVCLPVTTAATSTYACDDASDCPAPLTCCRSFASADETYACAKPSEDCAALPCAEPDGLTCPPGLRCNGSVCVADFRATCGGAKQCPKGARRCAWGKIPACVGDAGGDSDISGFGEEGSPISGLYECTKPSDCGGAQACCTSALYAEKATLCAHQCDAANSAQLCARDADCKSRAQLYCGDDARCRRAVRCAPLSTHPSSATPPWMKVCQRFDE
jgi:hypothetical protein